jgi:hypothetical protein
MASRLGDLVGRDRRSDRNAVTVPASGRTISYRDFCTTAWKTGHALRHLGVHAGSRVALAPDPCPQILATLFGGALLGARLTFDPTADARVVMGHVDGEAEMDDGERKLLVYGGAPASATTTHWEGVVWSENPSMPPGDRSSTERVLDGAGRTFTHEDLLERARRVCTVHGFEDAGRHADGGGDDPATVAVALRAPLDDPRAVIAGVVAPLLAGGTVVLPGEATGATADVAVVGADVDADAPEPRCLTVEAV